MTIHPLLTLLGSCLLFAGCAPKTRESTPVIGTTLAETNRLGAKPYAPTGSIPTEELDKMATAGEADFDERFLRVRLHNHFDHGLSKLTVRLVVRRGDKIRGDAPHERELMVAPNSDFQFTVKVKRPPTPLDEWIWSVVDAEPGDDPRL